VKGKGDMRYIGVGTGMNSLIRPALYGSYHEIVNLSRASETPSETATIVGPICETGDRLGTDRLLPPSTEGDVILIANAGAYGYVMSSQYNRREVAPEVVL
jgi:diaminopimelate decarboxylase/aspartate kinase